MANTDPPVLRVAILWSGADAVWGSTRANAGLFFKLAGCAKTLTNAIGTRQQYLKKSAAWMENGFNALYLNLRISDA